LARAEALRGVLIWKGDQVSGRLSGTPARRTLLSAICKLPFLRERKGLQKEGGAYNIPFAPSWRNRKPGANSKETTKFRGREQFVGGGCRKKTIGIVEGEIFRVTRWCRTLVQANQSGGRSGGSSEEGPNLLYSEGGRKRRAKGLGTV